MAGGCLRSPSVTQASGTANPGLSPGTWDIPAMAEWGQTVIPALPALVPQFLLSADNARTKFGQPGKMWD